jgi:hypothetical protein
LGKNDIKCEPKDHAIVFFNTVSEPEQDKRISISIRRNRTAFVDLIIGYALSIWSSGFDTFNEKMIATGLTTVLAALIIWIEYKVTDNGNG